LIKTDFAPPSISTILFLFKEDNKNMKELIQRVTKLLSIKSIVTIALTGVFCYLSIIKVIPAEIFMTVFTVVISFYFGTQATKE
jgi:hypothetical protein